jgi:ferredoxin
MPEKNASTIDIFDMLSKDSSEETKKKQAQEFLKPKAIKQFFKKGSIKVNKFTCTGVECKLCINACPTNALYWKTGEVGIIEDLCVYCGACVFNCMVDDCIKIERKREDGKVERFSKPKEVVLLNEKIGSSKRFERVKAVFPTISQYCENYCSMPKDEHTFFGYVNKSNNKQTKKDQKLKRHNRGNR